MASKPSGCAGCPYEHSGKGFNEAHRGNVAVAGGDLTRSNVLFVAEAPSRQEATDGTNLTGGSGTVLTSLCKEAGFDRLQYPSTHVIRCSPPNHETPDPVAIEYCRKYLEKDLITIQPNLIVGLGNAPLHAIVGLDNVLLRRGSLYDSPYGKYLAILQPAHIMKERMLLWPITRRDLGRVSEESIARAMDPSTKENFDWWPTPETVQRMCDEAAKRKLVVYDIETSYGNRLVRIGLGWKDWALSIPFIRGSGDVEAWYSPDDEKRVVRSLYEMFRDPAIEAWGHNNLTYDNLHMKRLGFEINNCHDTIVEHHVLYSELRHSLEFVGSTHSTVPYYKTEAKGKGEMALLDPVTVGRYNCLDIMATDQVREDITARLKGAKLWDQYTNISLPMQDVVATALRDRGVYIDQKALDIQAESLETEVEAIYEIIEQLTWPTFNPGTNSKDISKLLFECWGMKPTSFTDKRKEPRANDDALQRAANEGTPHQAFMIKLIRTYRSNLKVLSTWTDDFRPSDDGRLHSEWLAWRTKTGRMTSYPNLQNLPNDHGGRYRRIFGTQCEENVLVQSDYKQAELRASAILSQDESLLHVFRMFDRYEQEKEDAIRGGASQQTIAEIQAHCDAWDIHRRNAMTMWKCPVEEVTPARRKSAKIFAFRIGYGGGIEGMLSKAGKDVERTSERENDLREAFANYIDSHPGYFKWRDDIRDTVRKNRILHNPFGRMRVFFAKESEAVREAYDFLPQSTVGDAMNLAHIEIERWCQENLRTDMIEFGSWGVVLQLHDGLVAEIPKNRVDEYCCTLKPLLERPFSYAGQEWILPAEFKVGKTFTELKDL